MRKSIYPLNSPIGLVEGEGFIRFDCDGCQTDPLVCEGRIVSNLTLVRKQVGFLYIIVRENLTSYIVFS